MHFVGMLAFRLPGMTVAYEPGLTGLSLVVAIAATAVGFAVLARVRTPLRLIGAGIFMGLGIVSMHYLGMAAMRMAATVHHDPLWIAAAIAVAIGAATAALWLSARQRRLLERAGAAVAMGAAIAGMHYAAMAGATFTMDMGKPMPITAGISASALALGIAAAAFLILSLSLAAALVDRRLAEFAQREALALRSSEERFRALYRGTPLPLQSLDGKGMIQQVSYTWLDLLGYPEEEVIGRAFANFLTPESADRFQGADWRELMQNDRQEPKEYQAMTRSGQVLDLVAAGRVERDDQGQVVHVVGGLTDVTARKRAEEALRQTQKIEAIGQLTGGVAHDFNNLLAVVLGNLELLRKRLPANDPKLVKLVEGASEGARRGAALTQRLLAFARRQDLRQEAVDVPKLVVGMTELLQRSLGPLIEVRTHFPLGLPCAFVDPNQLELAILNLAVNARDAMPGGGRIEIAAAEVEADLFNPQGLAPGRYVRLCVTDEGAGMDASTLAKAAEPFFTTKGVGKGTGLGLSMVLGFAAQSGGRLELNSALGEGTTAELLLPTAAVATPPAEPRPLRSVADAPARTVLVVDDDPLVLANTMAMLEDLGHGVQGASNGAEAISLIDHGVPFDVVVSDQLMPGLTGVELAQALRTRWPGLPVLIVSGYAELEPELAQGLTLLRKPFGQAALAEAVEAVASQAKVVPLRRPLMADGAAS
jgi:PAS domain S-box-containing protein